MDRTHSKKLYQKATAIIPGGVNSPVRAFKKVGGTPVYVASAAGSSFVDVDGNRYVDFCQSWGPLILGHAHPRVVAAVVEAAPRGLSYGACHAAEVELAELVLEAFPGFDRVRAVSSGTEAVMTALRLARGATGRDLVVKFDGGYHGHFDGMLVKAGSGLATFAIADSGGVPENIAASTLVADLDREASVEDLFSRYGDRIAAVIIEPMPANNGLLLQRDEFLEFLRDITRRQGSLLIFDEVISGFRLRFGGYGDLVGGGAGGRVRPDLVTLGKIIGGGMPIGAVVGGAAVMDRLSPLGPVYQAGTLSGNPVSLAAGIATLKELRDNPPYDALERLGARLVAALEGSGLPWARAVRKGSVVWLYLDEAPFPRASADVSTAAIERFNAIYRGLLDQGLYLPPSAMEVMFLSAAHTDAEVDALARAVTDGLGAAVKRGAP
jgi:glutamate-1-semialdehyde 2,1-aminomutase